MPPGEHVDLETLARDAAESGCRHVVLTGGEPLLPPQCIELCKRLRRAGLHVTIETAGTIERTIECDLMSISPKLSASAPDAQQHTRWNALHQQRRMPIDVMKQLIERSHDYQIKFVVDSPDEFDEVNQVVQRLNIENSDVWIMPQGSTLDALDKAATWLRGWAEETGYHYCDRMQIRWFGNRRGT